MTLEEILKARGYTDADLAGMAPMLADARFRQSLEETYNTLETERNTLRTDIDGWKNKLDTEWNPQMAKWEQDAVAARKEAARLREELQIAKDYGYLSDVEAQKKLDAIDANEKRATDPNGYDPKRHPTFEDVNKFAEAEARAISLAQDLVMEYEYLNPGKSLFEYETSIDGRTFRGLSAIREEARMYKKPIDQYMFEKFDFPGKRKAMAEAKQKAYDDRLIEQGRQMQAKEYAEQYGQNPLLRTAVPSSRPIIPQPRDGVKSPISEEGMKVSRIDRANARVQRALESEAQQRSKVG